MLEKLPVAFLAGLVSVITPCVLPLVPGYLSALSSVDVTRLGERQVVAAGRARERSVHHRVHGRVRRCWARLLLRSAAPSTSDRNSRSRASSSSFSDSPSWGCCRGRNVRSHPGCCSTRADLARAFLLGGAFAVCAAPCIGTVLASILVLASSSGSIFRGVVLLVAYSLGLGAAFVAAGVAFAHAMRTFRWVRDHYGVVRVVSGGTLVVLGLLLFFNRDWWLRVALDQVFTRIGLGTV